MLRDSGSRQEPVAGASSPPDAVAMAAFGASTPPVPRRLRFDCTAGDCDARGSIGSLGAPAVRRGQMASCPSSRASDCGTPQYSQATRSELISSAASACEPPSVPARVDCFATAAEVSLRAPAPPLLARRDDEVAPPALMGSSTSAALRAAQVPPTADVRSPASSPSSLWPSSSSVVSGKTAALRLFVED